MLRQMERSTIHLMAKRGKSMRQIAAEVGHSPTHDRAGVAGTGGAGARQAAAALAGRSVSRADRASGSARG